MAKINVEYRPQSDYKKNYSMDGQYKHIEKDIEKIKDANDDKYSTIKKDLDLINGVIGSLPDSIQPMIQVPIAGMDYVLETFDPSLKDDEKDGMIITIPEDLYKNEDKDDNRNKSDNGDFEPDLDLFPSLPDLDIQVLKELEPAEKIKAQFQKDLNNIFVDFNSKLKDVLSNYYTSLLKTAKDCGISDCSQLQKEYELNSKDVKNKFISDAIIKSQIIRDQKQRLFKKFFDVDEMIITIRKCKIAEQLKIRYYTAQYEQNDDYLKVNKNSILSDARKEYDKKYKENLYGLYKCLNSTVILLDECLQQSLLESKAKAILIKEEGIKL